MTENFNELKEQIIEKNKMLDSYKSNDKKNSEKKRRLVLELDKLLYLYFKTLKSIQI